MELGEIRDLTDDADETVEIKRLDVEQDVFTITQGDSTVMLTLAELEAAGKITDEI